MGCSLECKGEGDCLMVYTGVCVAMHDECLVWWRMLGFGMGGRVVLGG